MALKKGYNRKDRTLRASPWLNVTTSWISKLKRQWTVSHYMHGDNLHFPKGQPRPWLANVAHASCLFPWGGMVCCENRWHLAASWKKLHLCNASMMMQVHDKNWLYLYHMYITRIWLPVMSHSWASRTEIFSQWKRAVCKWSIDTTHNRAHTCWYGKKIKKIAPPRSLLLLPSVLETCIICKWTMQKVTRCAGGRQTKETIWMLQMESRL